MIELENKIYDIECELDKLKPNTPHYRDTQRHLDRLKRKLKRERNIAKYGKTRFN